MRVHDRPGEVSLDRPLRAGWLPACDPLTGTPVTSVAVGVLRRFRDGHRMQSDAGRACVDWYCRYSPAIANFTSARDRLRAAVRRARWPLVWLVHLPSATAT